MKPLILFLVLILVLLLTLKIVFVLSVIHISRRYRVPHGPLRARFGAQHAIDLVIVWYPQHHPHATPRGTQYPRDTPTPRGTQYPHNTTLMPPKYTYGNHDELKYLLRSVSMFAPWINKVHLVTSTETTDSKTLKNSTSRGGSTNAFPAWLQLTHPQLNIVDITTIMPPHLFDDAHSTRFNHTTPRICKPTADSKSLLYSTPVFNMHAVEACLHKIPSLSEHYVYARKGMMFAAPTTSGDFFNTDGITSLLVSPVFKRPVPEVPGTKNSIHRNAWLNTYTALEALDPTCNLPQYLLCPQITATSLTLAHQMESVFAPLVRATSESTLPRSGDIHPLGLQLYGGLCSGRVTVAPHLPTMQYMDWSWDIDSVNKRRLKLVVKTRPQLLCVNNIGGSLKNVNIWYTFAEAYYHVASAFER